MNEKNLKVDGADIKKMEVNKILEQKSFSFFLQICMCVCVCVSYCRKLAAIISIRHRCEAAVKNVPDKATLGIQDGCLFCFLFDISALSVRIVEVEKKTTMRSACAIFFPNRFSYFFFLLLKFTATNVYKN